MSSFGLCKDCAHYEEFSGVCCYYKSKYVADFVDEYNSCEFFEREVEENEQSNADWEINKRSGGEL